MSKRITFTDEDIELIEIGLKMLQDKGDRLPITYPEYGLATRQRMKQIVDKLNSQHPRSVETLGVSGNGDKSSIASQKEKTNE